MNILPTALALSVAVAGRMGGCSHHENQPDEPTAFERNAVGVIQIEPIEIDDRSMRSPALSLPAVQGQLDGDGELVIATFDGGKAPKELIAELHNNTNGSESAWSGYPVPEYVWKTFDDRSVLRRVPSTEWAEGKQCTPFNSVGKGSRRLNGRSISIPWPDGTIHERWPKAFSTKVADNLWAGYAAFDPTYQHVLVSVIGPVVEEGRDMWGSYTFREGPYYVAVVEREVQDEVRYVLFELNWEKTEAGIAITVTPDGRWLIALAGTREAMWIVPLWQAADLFEEERDRVDVTDD